MVVKAADPDRGAPRIYTDPLPEFKGNPVEFEDWQRKAGALIKQTAYKHYLDREANHTDTTEVARSSELYNMILSCGGDGHTLNS